jgi:hypothetical protein
MLGNELLVWQVGHDITFQFHFIIVLICKFCIKADMFGWSFR